MKKLFKITNKILYCIFIIEFLIITNTTNNEISAINVNNDLTDACDVGINEQSCELIGSASIQLETSQFKFDRNEEIQISIYVNSSDEIANINYSENGIGVVSLSNDAADPNRIILSFTCDSDSTVSSLLLSIELSSGVNLSATLYAIQNDYGIFISQFSEEDAVHKYYSYAKTSGLISQEKYETLKAELYADTVIENISFESVAINSSNIGTMNVSTTETTIEGTLSWTDDDNQQHALRRVMIRLYDKELIGNTLIATTYSDQNGNYSFTFNNADGFWDFENGGNDIFLRIYAGDLNAMVEIGDTGEEYYYESSVYKNVNSGSQINLDYNVTMSNNLGHAFQISQAILTARDYAWNMMGEQPDSVSIRYPYDSGCYYDRENERITITGSARFSSLVPQAYASWDVIMHEYGHHISYQLNINDSPHGVHDLHTNLIDQRNNKDDGIKLAWAEAWPTVFAMQAQSHWHAYLDSIVSVNNTSYDAYNHESPIEIENNSTCLKGEGCELSIISFLWDLYDNTNDGCDKVSLGHTNYWNVTTGSQSKTFSDFIQNFYETYPELTDEIGKNLSYYKMATTKPIMTNASLVSQETPPTFSWQAQGGSTNFPNNRFQLIFYGISGSEVLRTTPTTTTTYTLSQSEWESLLYSFGTTYSVSVAAWQTTNPITGVYISERSSAYRKPTPENLTQSFTVYEANRYTEKIADLQPGQYIDYYVTFKRSGTRTVQTFGMKDTLLELYSADGTLLLGEMDTDDNGYESNAFFSYYFQANTVYKIRVMFYSSEDAGTVKMGIIPVYGFETYYDISNRKDNTTGTSWSFVRYYAKVLTFEYTETNTYTFTLTSEADAYLYIIDPRSTKPTGDAWLSLPTEDSIYNDDYEDGSDSRITKLFDANVPYLVIMTTYDPSLETSVGAFDLDIE